VGEEHQALGGEMGEEVGHQGGVLVVVGEEVAVDHQGADLLVVEVE